MADETTPPPPPVPQPTPRTAPTAISSLVLGILSYPFGSIFTAIPAVICGHVARSKIRKSGGALRGKGIATAGLILGYLVLALCALAIPLLVSMIQSDRERFHRLSSERKEIASDGGKIKVTGAAISGAQMNTEKFPVEEGYFTGTDNVRIFYRKLGAGQDFVVFLHGGPGLSMGDGGYAMRPLAERHTLILYDQRGGGRSDLVKDPTLLTADADVRDLEALRQHFGVEKMSLIGLSWGSGLAALYAAAHAESVSRIVFLDPMPIALNPYAKERDEKIGSLMKPDDKTRLKELVNKAKGATDEEVRSICREEIRIIFGPYLFHPDGHDRDWSEMCDESVPAIRNASIVGKAVTESLGNFDLRFTLAKLNTPALVIEGEKTNVPLDSTREWAKTPPNARLLLIPDAGHATFVDQPETLLREIEVFLGGAWPSDSKEMTKS